MFGWQFSVALGYLYLSSPPPSQLSSLALWLSFSFALNWTSLCLFILCLTFTACHSSRQEVSLPGSGLPGSWGPLWAYLKKGEKVTGEEQGRLSTHLSYIWSVVSEGLAKSCYTLGADHEKSKKQNQQTNKHKTKKQKEKTKKEKQCVEKLLLTGVGVNSMKSEGIRHMCVEIHPWLFLPCDVALLEVSIPLSMSPPDPMLLLLLDLFL